MKKIIRLIFGRRFLMSALFTDKEQVTIINSLFKNSEANGSEVMRVRAELLAKKLMGL